jgi:small subunit ribosomal protein S17
MAKTLKGTVVSVKMKDTVVVEVTRKTPHPLYKKLMTKSKKFKVGTNGQSVSVGDVVTIQETRQMAKDKYFKLVAQGETK